MVAEVKTFLPAENVVTSEKVLFLSSMTWALFWAEILGLLVSAQQSCCSGSDASAALPPLSCESVLKEHTASATLVDSKASCSCLLICFSSEVYWKWGLRHLPRKVGMIPAFTSIEVWEELYNWAVYLLPLNGMAFLPHGPLYLFS